MYLTRLEAVWKKIAAQFKGTHKILQIMFGFGFTFAFRMLCFINIAYKYIHYVNCGHSKMKGIS